MSICEVLGIKMKMELMNLTCKLPNFQLENRDRIPNPKAIYKKQKATSGSLLHQAWLA